MQLINVPSTIMVLNPNELTSHPRNDYFFPAVADDEEFLTSVRERGIIDMPLVSSTGVIVSGHRRVRAAITCGYEQIQCQVRDYDNDDMMLYDLLASNVMSRGGLSGLPVYQQARVLNELRRLYGNRGHGVSEDSKRSPIGMYRNINDMCEDLHTSRSAVGRLDKLAALDDQVGNEIGNRVSASGLIAIASLPAEQQREVADAVPEGDDKVSEAKIKELIQTVRDKDAEIERLNAEASEFEDRLERMVQRCDALEEGRGGDDVESIVQMQEEIRKYKISIAQLKDHLREKNKALSEIPELRQKIVELEDKLPEDPDAQANEMQRLQEENKALQAKVRELSSIDNACKTMSNAKEALQSMMKGIVSSELKQRAAEVDTAIANFVYTAGRLRVA